MLLTALTAKYHPYHQKKMRTLLVFCIAILASGLSTATPKVILKLDDFQASNGSCLCLPTLDYLVQKQIKAAFGAVASRFDSTALDILKPYLNATNTKDEKLFEIWHHGLDHKRPEFAGTSYEYQKAHFEEAKQLIQKYLGIRMNSFGTPYNASDSITNRVVAEDPNYKVFVYSSVRPVTADGIFYMDNRINMENGTGNPELEYFVTNYNKLKNKYTDYITLQGHPNQWTPEKLEQFKKIIDLLISEGCEFVQPLEYYKTINK
jgi:peptidoglycan/xylan/chitin deacetylase (PgdA/CDA1 family)